MALIYHQWEHVQLSILDIYFLFFHFRVEELIQILGNSFPNLLVIEGLREEILLNDNQELEDKLQKNAQGIGFESMDTI